MEILAKKINDGIKTSELYKRYFTLKYNVENDENLINIKIELEKLKKEICEKKNNIMIDKYNELEKKYKEHPVVCEYLNVKEELNDLLKDVVDILSLN